MSRRGAAPGQQGVALVVVLWVVAALTVLVSGLVAAQRAGLRLASAERARVLALAAGGAATVVVLQEQAQAAPLARQRQLVVRIDGQDVEVEAMPLTGLVDLNSAPEALLVLVFRELGQRDDAEALAAALVERRQAPAAAASGAGGFSSGPLAGVEQLLSVTGVDPDLVARIQPFVTTASGGSGRVNPMAAPPDILRLLTRGDEALAQRIVSERDAGTAMIDTSRLDANLIDTSSSGRLRLTARVPAGDGSLHLVRRDLELGRAAAPGAAPWRVLGESVTRKPAGTDDAAR